MKNIPLYVLDEYAKRLSDAQVAKLYEHKTNKQYKKELYEAQKFEGQYKLYLNAYTIASEAGKDKAEFIMGLTNNYPELMESVSYKVNADSITFSTKNRQLYSDLIQSIYNEGVNYSVLEELIDKNF